MDRPAPHRIVTMLALAGVAAVAFVLAYAAGTGSQFNPDESRWLSRAHYLADLAEPASPTWGDRYMTRGQPPLGSYAMGLALLLHGRDLQTNPPWDFSLPWEVNVAIGNKPAAADLAAGRAFSALLTALTAIVVAMVAGTFVSPWWAIAAGGLYAVHPFTTYIGSMAMSDALFGLLIACAAWAAAALARAPSRGRALALGAVLGLGGATKLSPLVVAAGFAAAVSATEAVSAARLRRVLDEHRRRAAIGLLVGVAAAGTFVAAYPYLWPDPITRTHRLFAFRAEEMATQASDWPEMAVPNRLEALRRVQVNFGERYNVAASILAWGNLGPAAPWLRQLEIALAGSGVAVLAFRAARAGPHSPRAYALAVLGGQSLVTIAGMRSEFDRYHVPTAILGAVAAVAAMELLVSLAAPFWRRTFAGPPASVLPWAEAAASSCSVRADRPDQTRARD